MAGDRFVLLGLARSRAPWFRGIGQWATAGAIPAEFVRCVSVEDVRARLRSGRPFSALLFEAGLPGADRELIDEAREAGAVALVVDNGRTGRNWPDLGAVAVLPADFTREQLVDALATHAAMVTRGDVVPRREAVADEPPAWHATVVAVCGTGGSGASTVAIALAQALGGDARHGGLVLLADLCRNADLAMLHDVGDVAPGVQELVDAHRLHRPSSEEVRALTWGVTERRYHLLLGLRRARHWAAVRPHSFAAAFASLRRAFRVLVCDVEGDVEGEREGGSVDVEERNLMARTAVREADVVFAVGTAGMKGVFALVRLLGELADAGVPPSRIVPVLNFAPRHPRERAELASAVADLLASSDGAPPPAAPLFLPRRPVEQALRDGVRLPEPIPSLVGSAFDATLARAGARPPLGQDVEEPEPVAPGSLGTRWR